jgi:hypothetical protein
MSLLGVFRVALLQSTPYQPFEQSKVHTGKDPEGAPGCDHLGLGTSSPNPILGTFQNLALGMELRE